MWFMKEIEKPNFKCLTTETLDDFTVMYEDEPEFLYQVKSNKITRKVFNEILNGNDIKEKRYGIIAQDYDDRIKSCLDFKGQLFQAEKSGRNKAEVNNIKANLKEKTDKLRIDFEKFIDTDMHIQAEPGIKEIILFAICEWCRDRSFESDFRMILHQLLLDIKEARGTRGFITIANLEAAAETAKPIKPQYTSIKSVDYDEYLISRMMEKSNEYPSMKDAFEVVCVYVKGGEYSSAKKKIEGLSEKEQEIFIDAGIWLDMRLGNYANAQKLCDECLNNNDFANVQQEVLYYFKGIIAEQKKDYKSAYKYYTNSRRILGESDVFTDLAFRFARCATLEGKDYEEAYNLLEYCSNTMKDNTDLLWVKYGHPYYPDKNKLLEQMLAINEEECFIAHAFLAENLRSIGKYQSAVSEYEKYFSKLSNLQDYKTRIGYISTLLDIGNEDEARSQHMFFVNAFLKQQAMRIEEGKATIIMDISWDKTRFYTCKRERDGFIFHSPLGDIICSTQRAWRKEIVRQVLVQPTIGLHWDSLKLRRKMVVNRM